MPCIPATPVFVPTATYEGSPYSTSWSRFHSCVLSDDGQSLSHCGFYLHVCDD